MISTTYSSMATVPFSDEELDGLLAVSRTSNAARGLTGMLLYHDGRFMQVLEGPEDAVRSALVRIAADPRHSGVWTLSSETIEERAFPGWTMGYRTLTDETLGAAPGSDAYLAADGAASWRDSERAKVLLDWFRTH